METRRLGNTDLDLSVIGLGTWAIGGEGWEYGWGPQQEEDSRAAILEGLENGVNWIDTAPAYGLGKAEEVVGKIAKEFGGKVIIATKCGLIRNAKGRISPKIKRESIIGEAEASLRRLGREIIDLYQIHWPNPSGDIEEAWGTLLDLKSQGKIRWAGVCNFSVTQLNSISHLGPVSSLQPPLSFVNRGVEKEILPWCVEHGAGAIVYSPLQCGVLTGKVTREWISALPNTDWRKAKLPYLHEPKLSAVLELVSGLQAVSSRNGRSVPEAAISWVLSRPGVTSAIVGARRKGQIAVAVKGAGWKLNQLDYDEMEAIYGTYLHRVS